MVIPDGSFAMLLEPFALFTEQPASLTLLQVLSFDVVSGIAVCVVVIDRTLGRMPRCFLRHNLTPSFILYQLSILHFVSFNQLENRITKQVRVISIVKTKLEFV